MTLPNRSTRYPNVFLRADQSYSDRPTLSYILSSNKYDIVCITETWPNSSYRNTFITHNIHNYSIFIRDRKFKRGGSLIIFVNHIYSTQIYSNFHDNFELLEVNFLSYKLILVFRINLPITKNDNCSILIGDFNFPSINWTDIPNSVNSIDKSFMHSIISNSFTQCNDHKTIYKSNRASFIIYHSLIVYYNLIHYQPTFSTLTIIIL